MSVNQLRILGAGLFYLFIFLSGIWLTRSGRPYNTIVLTIHKLISVAAVVFLVVVIHRMNKAASLSIGELASTAITGLFFLGTIVTGGLLSADKPMPGVVLWLHRITPFLTVLSTAVTLYLVMGSR
jgi:hypothetical protein